MVLAAERSKHPRSGRPVCVHPEPGRGLGPDRSLAVVARRDLDVDAAAPPLGVGVLDLRIRVEHASLRVDGEAELSGGTVPLGVGGPATVSRTRGLAPARDSALEFAVEPYAPDGGAPLEQALAFAAGGDSLTDPAVERNDPGSGTGTLDIRADVDAFDEAGGLFTEFSVQVRDGIGEPVTGATVGTDLPPRVVPHPMLVPAPVEGREGRASSGTRATRPYHRLVLPPDRSSPGTTSLPAIHVERRPLTAYAQIAGGDR